MTTEKMNVHQALAELKMLDKRISAELRSEKWVIENKHSNTKIGGIPVADYVKNVEAHYQKVTALIDRAEAIKRAVVNSNAVTEVVIGDKKYTVAEAIDMKNKTIPRLIELRDDLVADYKRAKTNADYYNDSLEARADKHVESMYGKSDMKGLSEDAKKAREDYIKSQTYELIDPINVRDEIEALTLRIDAFTVNVDAALSASNALTEIEVTY